MTNYLHENYPKVYKLCIKCIENFQTELNLIKSAMGNNDEEIIFKTILLQYCLIAKQDLYSIFLLSQDGQLFTPQLILRNLLEHYITYIYIEQNPSERAKQYSLSGIKRKKGILEWIIKNKVFSNTINKEKNIENEIIKLEKQYEEYKEEIENWPTRIERRAKDAKILDIYLIYRHLCILSHPDSNNINFFFREKDKRAIFDDFNEDNTFTTLFLALYITNHLFRQLNDHFELNMNKLHEELDQDIKLLTNLL